MPSKTNARHRAGRFGATVDVRAASTTIEQGIAEYMDYHTRIRSSEKTIYGYRSYLIGTAQPEKERKRARPWTPFLPWCKAQGLDALDDLSQDVVDRYFDTQHDAMTRSVHVTAARYLRRWLKWLVDHDLAKNVPATVTPPKEKRGEINVFTKEEMIALRNVVQRENIRDWAIFLLLVDTGIRASELCGIRIGDIGWKRREIRITGKGNKVRDVPITAAYQALMRYREIRTDATKPIDTFFLAFYGTPVISNGNNRKNATRRATGKLPLASKGLKGNGLYQLVAKWGRLAGIEEARCSPHTFRHYFAVNFLRNGGNVMELQRILGHTDLSMTRRYVELAQVDISNAHKKYSPGLDLLPGRYQRFDPTQGT